MRLIMALKLISLGRGASGVRLELIRLIEAMLAKGVIPVIPEKGSVGASGDLAPLAHMAATMIGEGEAFFEGERHAGRGCARKAGLAPVVLAAKEGLALINGTQISTALALAGLFRAHRAAQTALDHRRAFDRCRDGLVCTVPSGHPYAARPQGPDRSGRALRALLAGSEIRESHRRGRRARAGPLLHPLPAAGRRRLPRPSPHVARTLEIEANAVTDNPLVLADDQVVSGGNFHAEPVAFAADQIALAICEIGAIAQRRIALLVDPALSYGLPAFLSKKPGLNSGLMIAEVTSAALMSENKQMSHPASVNSTPTSANQEDHVSMACHGARRLLADDGKPVRHSRHRGAGRRAGRRTARPAEDEPRTEKAAAVLRSAVPALDDDRYMAPDLAAAAGLVASGALVAPISAGILPLLEA